MNARDCTPVGVILPDGSIDLSAVHLVPPDVELKEVDPLLVEAAEEGVAFRDMARYIDCRHNGCGRKLAAVLATRRFPGVRTDAEFNKNKFSGDDDRNGLEQVWLRERAEAAGVSTTGKWYCRGLASYPGDPTAWIDSRGDVERIAREKNMTVHGYVEHEGHEVDPGEDVPIAPELLDAEVADIVDSNPGVDAALVRERMFALRTGAVDPNPLLVAE